MRLSYAIQISEYISEIYFWATSKRYPLPDITFAMARRNGPVDLGVRKISILFGNWWVETIIGFKIESGILVFFTAIASGVSAIARGIRTRNPQITEKITRRLDVYLTLC